MVGEVLAQVTGFRCGCRELHGASDLAQHVARHINARVFNQIRLDDVKVVDGGIREDVTALTRVWAV